MKLSNLYRSTGAIISLVLLLFGSSPSFSHHSQALFDTTKVISFEGEVYRLDWKNPHIYLIVETVNDEGETILQEIEGLAITQARVDGLDKNNLQPGTKVTVRANPNVRGPGKTVRGLNVTTMDGKVHPFYERSTEQRVLQPAEGLSGKWAPSLAETGKVFGLVRGSWQFKEEGGDDKLRGSCDIEPVPFLTLINELRVIEVDDDQVVMRHDNSGDIGVRTVYLNQAAHPADLQPSLFGHSIGHWEDNTLVIDTVGYTAHVSGLFSGYASGARKHTVERLTLTDDRRQLRYEFSIEDPDFLKAPASFTMLWDHRPDLNMSTEPCEQEISDRYLEY